MSDVITLVVYCYPLLPPLLTIVIAFTTRKAIPALLLGIIAGTWISQKNLVAAFVRGGEIVWQVTEFAHFRSWESFNQSWNLFIILFCYLLGCIINLVQRAGGARAYGEVMLTTVKTRIGAALATMVMGIIIFFDDYFNCLTVGSVMRPVTDRFRISRAKLAYLVDSTTAPVCILAPISSWAVEVMTQLRSAGVGKEFAGDPQQIFLWAIAFNSYAWLTLLMVAWVCISQRDFGPMYRCEMAALSSCDPSTTDEEAYSMENMGTQGGILDITIPIAMLISLVLTLLYFTSNIAKSMFFSGVITLLFSSLYFSGRGLIMWREIGQTLIKSMRTMTSVVVLLVLAWALGRVIRDELHTGEFLSQFLRGNTTALLLPAIIFILSCATAFATGTSWGTFAIMIPIVTPLAMEVAPSLFIPSIAAILSGAIFGDHASPISDTTILSSVGAGCRHIDHVSTQTPYSLVVAIVALVGFVIHGLTIQWGMKISIVISMGVNTILLYAILRWVGKPISQQRESPKI